MKKLYKYIVFVIGILAFSACTDDVEFPNVEVEEGAGVTLSLSLKPEISKEIINSRATADENKLYDLHIYVFEPIRVVNGVETGGKLIGYEKIVSASGDIKTPGVQDIQIRTKTGASYIFALANINQGDTYYLDNIDLLNLGIDKDKSTLYYDTNTKKYIPYNDETNENYIDVETAINQANAAGLNLTTFKNIQYSRQAGDESQLFSPTPQYNKYVMSGYLNNGQTVTIQKDVNGYGSIVETDKVIKLYRILAKNTLTIDWSQSRGKFTPKYYRLCEVPTKGMLIPNANINTAYGEEEDNDVYLTEANVTNTLNQNIPTISTYRENLQLTSADEQAKRIVLTFHYPENLRSFERNQEITDWNDREVNDYSSGSKVFTNAPDKSAYIEIHGDYVDNAGNLTANVSYTIHLGNFSQKKNPVNNPTLYATLNAKRMSDFNVVRNHSYIYNVYINGVNDVIAEARDQHDNPYAEGLVIYTGKGEQYELDAHYEARVMEFDRQTMVNLKGTNEDIQPGYVVNISTPFGNTPKTVMVKQITRDGKLIPQICNLNGDELATVNPDGTLNKVDNGVVFEGEEDYTWMTFVKNTNGNKTNNNNDISKYICKFPEPNDPDNPKLNVFQLLAELYNTDGNVYDTNGKVYYTCFVDEYYYNDRPWSQYANKPKRSMQIAINKQDLYVSDDSKSVYAEVAYGISQRSITTFYNPLLNIVAFGTENVDEEDVYNERLGSWVQNGWDNKLYTYYDNLPNASPQNWNGWTSAISTMKDEQRPWYEDEEENENGNKDVVSIINVEGVQPLYRAALKACMSRNRDNDGDGLIDSDEVRWYLATVDQYRALFYSQSLLDEDVRLFGTQEDITELQKYAGNYNFEQRGIFHYWTASNRANSGTFWPEEGMTNNPAGDARDYLNWSGVCRAELVRCVRTIGNGTTSVTDDGLKNPTEFFDFYPTDDSGNKNVISVHGMVVKRKPSEEALPNHNESEATWNDFVSKIAVAANDLRNGSNQEDRFSSTIARGDDPCSDYKYQSNAKDYEKGYNWRMPNQKEFALILATVDKMPTTDFAKGNFTTGNYITRTHFSGTWHPASRNQTAYIGSEKGSINLSQHSNGRIRCVRDVETSTNTQ